MILQYDLRGVLMHTGLPGRKQIYSYVQDTYGVWWKTLDYTVIEVRPHRYPDQGFVLMVFRSLRKQS